MDLVHQQLPLLPDVQYGEYPAGHEVEQQRSADDPQHDEHVGNAEAGDTKAEDREESEGPVASRAHREEREGQPGVKADAAADAPEVG